MISTSVLKHVCGFAAAQCGKAPPYRKRFNSLSRLRRRHWGTRIRYLPQFIEAFNLQALLLAIS
jgi:hypothetical protein